MADRRQIDAGSAARLRNHRSGSKDSVVRVAGRVADREAYVWENDAAAKPIDPCRTAAVRVRPPVARIPPGVFAYTDQ